MATIQEFLVISPRGDTLIIKNYLGTAINRATADIFLRHLKKEKLEKKSCPPMFVLDGVTYCHLQQNSMYFLFTATKNVQAAALVECLHRIARLFKDYCGVLTEESVRRNFLLLYELLDEVFDRGFPQGMSTELLKAYVYNEPVAVSAGSSSGASGGMSGRLDKLSTALADKVSLGERRTMASAAANKPIAVGSERRDNTIFVDLIEKLTLVSDRAGNVTQSYINGSIVLKSFMTGSPEMRLGLNEECSITSLGVERHYGGDASRPAMTIDDISFHECVRWEEGCKLPHFTFFAPDGEFTLLTYRISSPYRPPISLTPFLEPQGPNGLDYVIRVRGDFPHEKTATNVTLTFALPAWATSVSVEVAASGGAHADPKAAPVSGGKAELDRKAHTVTWVIPKLPGGAEALVRAKIVLASTMQSSMCELSDFGIVKTNFELPMYVLSGLQIKFLDFLYGSAKSPPNKWIRYVTHALSYVGRW
eukprot:CAMPEP_0181301630 /NCGR_PEP_ID=MMETSP1101-20121128/7527_1 /TAXON_ID=46948 /ORGANISM="Rhodomonas abbreviata, Strain Caron Lab Isolate" /LENGTH=477 /DNA_ID=CAMNT_0023406949 /DNA_START=232 /DNA_END=1662 /DNA_ORIENTATION=-